MRYLTVSQPQKWVLTLMLIIGTVGLSAQTLDTATIIRQAEIYVAPKIAIQAKSGPGGVKIRWAINDPEAWELAREKGFRLESVAVDGEGAPVPGSNWATDIRPWSLSTWKLRSEATDSLSALAAQLLYGSDRTAAATPNFDLAVQQADLRTNRHLMSLLLADRSFQVARGLGLGYLDSLATGGERLYRIKLVLEEETLMASCGVNGSAPALKAPPITVTPSDGKVRISWEDEARTLTGFYLEYKAAGGSYVRFTDQPYYPPRQRGLEALTAAPPGLDVPVINYQPYTFRLLGFDAFGDLSLPSNEVTAFGRDQSPPPAARIEVAETETGQVQVSWNPVNVRDLAGYIVARGEKPEGPFLPLVEELLPPATTTFLDRRAVSHFKNFYVVTTVDTAGNTANSSPVYAILTDEQPPTTPTGFTAIVDTNGRVDFSWRMGPEPDLMGYVIYYANDPEHAFIPLTSGFINDTIFADTIDLRNLTEEIHFRIAAFDYHRNPSDYSPMITAQKPDLIPPSAPVLKNYVVTDSSVVLRWYPSSSMDVQRTLLERRRRGNQDWQWLATLGSQDTTYADFSPQSGIWYEYRLRAEDEAGLRSVPSFPLSARPYFSAPRQSIKLKADYQPGAGNIVLEWPADDQEKETSYRLYRKAEAERGLSLYATIQNGQSRYTDNRLRSATSFVYKLIMVDENGRKLADSPEVVIHRE